MIPIPTGVRVWPATGHTDMRCGFPSLAMRVQEVLKRDAMGGGLFCFRGKRGDLLKIIWHDGQGACLFTRRLERGRFIWPSVAGDLVHLTVTYKRRIHTVRTGSPEFASTDEREAAPSLKVVREGCHSLCIRALGACRLRPWGELENYRGTSARLSASGRATFELSNLECASPADSAIPGRVRSV